MKKKLLKQYALHEPVQGGEVELIGVLVRIGDQHILMTMAAAQQLKSKLFHL